MSQRLMFASVCLLDLRPPFAVRRGPSASVVAHVDLW